VRCYVCACCLVSSRLCTPVELAVSKQSATAPNRYKEADLNVGENSCVDRCASKYWQVTGIVGQLLGGGSAQG